jgi:hypothetical protein
MRLNAAFLACIFLSLTATALLIAQTGGGQTPVRGPNGPYNPKDLAATKPIDEPNRAAVVRALKGSIDLHLHTAPADPERPVDAIDAANLAKSLGMRAILITSHYEPTAALAFTVRKAVSGLEVFGGVSFELSTGGINPAAVEQMLRVKGAYGRLVEFPTFDTEWRVQAEGKNRPFVAVSRKGELVPEAKQVIALVAKHNLILSTGHSTAEDALLIVREANRQGVKHLLVGHNPELSIAQMQEAIRLGAYIEFAKQNSDFPGDSYGENLRKIGPEHALLAETGVSIYPPNLVGAFAAQLKRQSFTDRELDIMMKENPAKMLDLGPAR